MKYLPLLWAGLWRKPIRTVLTLLSIAVAFLLFGVLHGVIAGFDGTLAKLSDTRLRVTNRANLFEAMPVAYQSRIALVPAAWKGCPTSSCSAGLPGANERFLDCCRRRRQLARHVSAAPRLGCHTEKPCTTRAPVRSLAIELMKQFNWHIGDRITLHSVLWANNETARRTGRSISSAPPSLRQETTARSPRRCTSTTTISMRLERRVSGTVNQFVVSLATGARSGRDRDRDRPAVRKLEQRNDAR